MYRVYMCMLLYSTNVCLLIFQVCRLWLVHQACDQAHSSPLTAAFMMYASMESSRTSVLDWRGQKASCSGVTPAASVLRGPADKEETQEWPVTVPQDTVAHYVNRWAPKTPVKAAGTQIHMQWTQMPVLVLQSWTHSSDNIFCFWNNHYCPKI